MGKDMGWDGSPSPSVIAESEPALESPAVEIVCFICSLFVFLLVITWLLLKDLVELKQDQDMGLVVAAILTEEQTYGQTRALGPPFSPEILLQLFS